MSILDHHWFSTIIRPSRYLGSEFNAIRKDPAHTEVSIALAFPDVYEVGMSHLGLKLLYHLLNSHAWLAAERVFSPWVDLEKKIRAHGIPLATLESGRPLSHFDIIGFSLQYELSYTNILNMLDLSGIPVKSSQRDADDPLIIAGGPVCFNPEPVADFFDIIVVGDGESVAVDICRAMREQKRGARRDKKAIMAQLSHIPGIYVPSHYRIQYTPAGRIDQIEPLGSAPPKVTKAIIPDIDQYPFPVRPVVPFTELVHDRYAIEISRGCTRGCRFCQAGMIYRPVRERSPLSVLEKAAEALGQSGYEELSLLSLSSGDYGCIEPLLRELMDRFSANRTAVSLPSLRIDSLSPLMIEEIKRVRKTGFTLAVEAGSERLRTIINKGLTQKDILDMARTVYGSGWNLIKLYFMVGLPFETDKDIEAIVDLARKVAGIAGKRGNKPKLNVSISTFVPKSHTPFMWATQISVEESRRRIKLIRDKLRGHRIRVKWNQPELSWMEGIFARGDRRLSRVILEAWERGARYDAWSEHFRLGIWEQAFRAAGLEPAQYLHRERPLDEILPWDHISSGVRKDFLKNEWHRALHQRLTTDCRKRCLECGVCDHKTVDPILFRESDLATGSKSAVVKPSMTGAPRKYRITFTKLNSTRHLSHLELSRTFIRAFRRAGLNLAYSGGFHPMPRVSFACALPVGTESQQETLDLQLTESADPVYLKNSINRQLPGGIAVTDVEEIPPGRKKARLRESHFQITLEGVALKTENLKKFLESEYFPVVKMTKKGEHSIDARPLIKAIRITSSNSIKIALKHTDGPQLKPGEIINGIFPFGATDRRIVRILKIKQELG